MPRQARKKSESGIYHVMLRGINQQQIFEDDEDCEKFIQVVKDCKAISGFKLFAYCLMGNHVHLLLKEEKEPLEQIIRRLGARFVYWYNIKYQRVGHLFQDRFKSEPVETDEYFLTVIRYIHQNPVKANICKEIADYKFSSYREYLVKNHIADTEFVLEMIKLQDFVEFNHQEDKTSCLDISDEQMIRLTDEQARRIIERYAKCKSVSEFQSLDRKLKTKHIKKIHAKGVSIRQVVRLCGETKSMVEKSLKQ